MLGTNLHKLEVFIHGINDTAQSTAKEIVSIMNQKLHSGAFDYFVILGDAKTVDIGEWDDDHPINSYDTPIEYYYSLFGEDYDSLVEKLAEIEHIQWMAWTRGIIETTGANEETYCRWRANWKPYSELSEEVKEKNRIWAKKVLEAMGYRSRNDKE